MSRIDAYSAATSRLGKILLGLASPVYFNGFSPFLNWWKIASPPAIVRSSGNNLLGREVWDAGSYLDVNTGEIVNPAPADLVSISRTFFKSANRFQVEVGCNYLGEEWVAVWDGSAVGHVEFSRGNGSRVQVGQNQISFTTGRDPDEARLRLTLTDRYDPPRNIRIFQARYLRNLRNYETFNPDWLAQVGQFGVLRFMDWMSTNNSTISEFSQLADKRYFSWGQSFISQTTNGEFGPKGGMHPELICELANRTNCNIHVCIPVQSSDDFVKSFASYFNENTHVEVTYELSNECWNPTFGQFDYCRRQGSKIWPGDRDAYLKWYGYRGSECMKIISDVYADPLRWRGCLATQTVDPEKTLQILAGIDFWRAHRITPTYSVPVSNLFQSLYVTGYFGDVVSAKEITLITSADPGVVVCREHGFKAGQTAKLFLTNGPIQLNDRLFTVANSTADTFELKGVSTAAMGTELPPCRLATSQRLPSSPKYDNGESGIGATLTGSQRRELVLDGVALSWDDIILVKDQDTRSENGIYRLTRGANVSSGWKLTRVTYFDRASNMLAGSAVRIATGKDASQLFVLEAPVETVGLSDVRFARVEPRNYAVDSRLFELIEKSNTLHAADATTFPTKYAYFDRQVARALVDGKCETSFSVSESIAAMEHVYWPRQLAIAQANHLTLRQYEGGCGLAGEGLLLGDPRALIYGGNERFGEYVFNFGHSEAAAAVYTQAYAAFRRIGGEYPAKYGADGRSSNAGTWAGVRFWPLKENQDTSDAGNPVWLATLKANGDD